MIDFIDRVSSGKKIIKYGNGTTEIVTIENAEDATVDGTPLNREKMMAIQGFINSNVTINKSDNVTVITNTNAQGHTTTTTITVNEDKSITVVEVFVGEKTITKTTTINAAVNNISEVIS